MTGLVIGSIAPDFEKFIKMSSGNIYSHTFSGIFWFNLPLALSLAFIFHLVVRNALINHLPVFFRSRLERFKGFNWIRHFKANPGIVALSIIVGSFSHILLDSVTHSEAPYIYLFPGLLKWITFGPFGSVGYVTLMWVVILSFTFSIFGLIYILYSFITLPAEPVKETKKRTLLKFWLLVLVVACLTVFFKLTFGPDLINNWQWIYISISAGLMGIFSASAFWAKVRLH